MSPAPPESEPTATPASGVPPGLIACGKEVLVLVLVLWTKILDSR